MARVYKHIYIHGDSSIRLVFKQLLGGIFKLWSEFCKRCFWVVSSNRRVFINLCETYIAVIVWLSSVFLLFRAVTVCTMVVFRFSSCLELSPCALWFSP